MSKEIVPFASSTLKSKIEKYGLEDMVIRLRNENGMTYEEIATALNNSGKVPMDDEINLWVVERYLKKIPQIQKNLMQQDKRRLLKVMNNQVDIIGETTSLYNRTKGLLLNMEQEATDKDLLVSSKAYKAMCSEMRALLKQMTDIQKEVNDFDNVKKFMEIVLETVQECAPESMPMILDKLRIKQNSVWTTPVPEDIVEPIEEEINTEVESE